MANERSQTAGTVEKAAKRLGCSQITVKRGLARLNTNQGRN